MKERRPTDFELRNCLANDLLRVLPHVLVAPLAITEADHGADFGEERFERSAFEQGVEASLRIVGHHESVEVASQIARVVIGGRTKIGHGRPNDERCAGRGVSDRSASARVCSFGRPFEGNEGLVGLRSIVRARGPLIVPGVHVSSLVSRGSVSRGLPSESANNSRGLPSESANNSRGLPSESANSAPTDSYALRT